MGKQIPKFETPEEESAHWSRTGLEELAAGQVEEVQIERPAQPLSTTFAVRLDQDTVRLIRQIARSQGVGPTQLVRAWVLERLRIERSVGALAEPATDYPSEFELELRKTVLTELFRRIPEAAEAALQEVLDRGDQEIRNLHASDA